MRTRCSPRWARWRPPGRSLNGLPECGAVDLWKRCVDGGQAEGGAWGDRDRDRDGDRHRGGAGVGGGGVAFGDGWIEARPTPTSAPAPKRRNTQTRTRAHRQTRPHGTTARPPPTVPPAPRALGSLARSLTPSPFPNKKSNIGQATYARRRICRHTRCGVPDPDRLVRRSGHDVVPVGRDGDRADLA